MDGRLISRFGPLFLVLVLCCSCGNGSESDPDWPPALESLFDMESDACLVPACDESGSAGFEPSTGWMRTLTTTSTTCSEMIASMNPRAQVGNVDEEGPLDLVDFSGTCFHEDGLHVATVKRGIFARCLKSTSSMDVVTYSTAIVEMDGDQGEGKARVYIRNLPGGIEGCDIDLDVSYQR